MVSLSDKLSIKNVSFKDKRVFLRADFNVPMHNGVIKSLKRIEATLDSINYILKQKPKALIIASHLGRTDGQHKPELSLKPVAEVLETMLQTPVTLLENYLDTSCQEKINNSVPGKIYLLENLRFNPEEEGSYLDTAGNKIKSTKESIDKFRKSLSALCDIYVNDAFGTAHRAHSSIVGIDVKEKVCGLLMLKELENFALIMENPKKPFMAILGGAKVSDKITLIRNLLPKIDYCVIVGGMSYTFAKSAGISIGSSIFDEKGAKEVPLILEDAKKYNVEVILPLDIVISDNFSNDAKTKVCGFADGIPDQWMGMDIGPKTISKVMDAMSKSATIVWNGPAGVFEMSNFCQGTNALLKHMSTLTSKGVVTVIGGGDTASAATKLQNEGSFNFTHISTGGGASLELLEGKDLPGIATLSSKSQNGI